MKKLLLGLLLIFSIAQLATGQNVVDYITNVKKHKVAVVVHQRTTGAKDSSDFYLTSASQNLELYSNSNSDSVNVCFKRLLLPKLKKSFEFKIFSNTFGWSTAASDSAFVKDIGTVRIQTQGTNYKVFKKSTNGANVVYTNPASYIDFTDLSSGEMITVRFIPNATATGGIYYVYLSSAGG